MTMTTSRQTTKNGPARVQAHRIDVLASKIKLGDIYVTRAAFAAERRREVIGLRKMAGPSESYIELTLKRDADAPNGSEASVPMRRRVTVQRHGEWPYSHGPYSLSELGDARMVIRRRDEDHGRTVAFIECVEQWERFTATLDAGLDEVAAVHAIDGGRGTGVLSADWP
jgi:hypothetical protein